MRLLLLAALWLLMSPGGAAQKPEIFQTGGIAIKGYDPVAFFTQQQAIQGNQQYSYEWKNAIWLFANAQHRDSFAKAPERFAPQYGGWCAYGLAGGYKAPTETDTWTIVDGKLYFNYNQKVKATWNRDTPNYILKGDRNWPGVRLAK